MSDGGDTGAEIFRTPGQLVQKMLEERGWTQRTLAIVVGIEETGLNHVLAGRRAMKADLALAISEVLPVDPARLMALQNEYELAQARILARPDPDRAKRVQLFGQLPVAEMSRRGWIAVDDVRDVPQVEKELTRFFGAGSVDDIEILPHAAKRTQVSVEPTPTQLAWIYRVRQIADVMMAAKFSQAALKAAIKKLASLLSAPEEARKVPRILAEAGVRFLVVETLPGAKIDGVCFWLGDKPVIGITTRFDRIDNFWFVLRHECEHVLRGHGRNQIMLDTDLGGTGVLSSVSEEEAIANEAAAEFCVPQRQLQMLISRKAPFFAERDIIAFARTLGIHPGLVAGQLQHKTGHYDRFRKHQVKIRKFVRPGAMVDGWGDVAPI